MRVVFVLASLLLLPLSVSAAESLKVVTSFSILADMARQVGRDHVQVVNLVGPDTDAQDYNPTSNDAKALARADVIIENGLGFEPWMEHLVVSSGTKKTVTVASTGISPRTVQENGGSVTDPHAWQSLPNAELYVNNVVNALSAADPDHANAYISGGKVYIKQLHGLKIEARLKLGTLPVGTMPAGSRRFVVAHDGFGYLSPSYQIEFVAPQDMKDMKAKAVFMDNTQDPDQLKKFAEDNGVPLGGTLYSDALAAKGPASTFVGMDKANINALADALGKP
ncbi:MAG: metal transporter substrate-binding protein [Pseudomonas sp.]|nr:metal transporter substrate-binding protein [Pseudomonas sp.]